MPVYTPALGAFAQINNATGRGIVQLALNDESQLTKAGTYNCGRLIGRNIRWSSTERRNNATRESFLRSLADALGIKDAAAKEHGTSSDRIKLCLNDALLDRIAKALDVHEGDGTGAKLLGMSDFKIENGCVVGGRPLTERRITAIVNRVYEKARADGSTEVRPQGEKIDSTGQKFNEGLSREIADLKDSGWNAKGNVSHQKLLAGLLEEATNMPFGKILEAKKGAGNDHMKALFARLCSRFASDGAGGTKFDEKGFYKDIEQLNAISLRAIGNVDFLTNTKTVNAVALLKAMNEVSPRSRARAVMIKSEAAIDSKVDFIQKLIDNGELKAQAADGMKERLAALFEGVLATSFKKDEVKANIRQVVDECLQSQPGDLAAEWVKENLSVSIYREIMRIRTTAEDAKKDVAPVKAEVPKGLKRSQINKLHRAAKQFADNFLAEFEKNGSMDNIDSFLNNFGTLDRQVVEDKAFAAFCKDPLVMRYLKDPIVGSSGSVEFDPQKKPENLEYGAKQPVSEFKFDADGKPDIHELEVEEGEGKVANRLAAELVATYANYARNLGSDKAKPDVTILSPIFIREMYPYKISSTVSLKNPDGTTRTLADEPLNGGPFDQNQVWNQDQEFGQKPADPFRYRYAVNAFTNLKNFFENNIARDNTPAYKEILGFVSVAVMGPTGISGLLAKGEKANFGFGTTNVIMNSLPLEGKRSYVVSYLDQAERNVSLSIEKGADGNPAIVISHKQELAMQFNGVQDADAQHKLIRAAKFGIHKGYCVTKLTIPLNQESPGTSKGPKEDDREIANPPKFTLTTEVVPDKD